MIARCASARMCSVHALAVLALIVLATCMSALAMESLEHKETQRQHIDDAYLYPRVDSLFPTRSLLHVEPLLRYRVLHKDNAFLHTPENLHPDSTHPLRYNAANSIGAHSMKMRHRHGHKQPFPDSISISFRAFDREWQLDNLQLDEHVWAPHSYAESHAGVGGTVTRHQLSLNTYRSDLVSRVNGVDTKVGWAVVTLADDGLLTGTLHTPEDTFQISPLSLHARELDPELESTVSLRKAAVHGMVVFRHSDTRFKGTNPATGQPYASCGLVKPRGDVYSSNNRSEVEQIAPEDIEEHAALIAAPVAPSLADGSDVAAARRLMSLAPGVGVDLWTSCFTGDSQVYKLSQGIVADVSFYTLMGSSVPTVLNAIAHDIASVNAVYRAQFRTVLQLATPIVMTAADRSGWNYLTSTSTGRCSNTIDSQLNAFTSWRSKNNPTNQGLWHLLTDCWPIPGTIGLAWLGVACSSQYGTGVSSWTSTHWLVVAHEIGHNLNAQHSFQNGQGTTGGIMDYGDGEYPIGSGILQFHPINKGQICPFINNLRGITSIQPFCFVPFAPVCGNGLIEYGESCDDTTACCSNCQLLGQCSPGANAAGNPCCTSSCTYAPTTVLCQGGNGFCGNGACRIPECTDYGIPFCGMDTSACRVKCGGKPSSYQCSADWSSPNTLIEDGTVCRTGTSYATCASGSCVASTPPPTWVSGTPVCACSGISTILVQCKVGTTVVDDSQCLSPKPATTGTCTPPSTCYVWEIQSSWSSCSNDCEAGIQTRTVQCVQSSTNTYPGTVVTPSTLCTGTMPATSQSCTIVATCPTSWLPSSWSECSFACGTGTRTRTLQCMKLQNGVSTAVNSIYCAAPVPITIENCNTQQCPDDGKWLYSSWTSCSVSCGGGVRTRTLTCVDAVAEVPFPDYSHCWNAGTPETLTESCATQPCPNYQWTLSSWSACSANCSTGIQTRIATCYDIANDPTKSTPVSTTLCPLPKPVTSMNCNTTPCPNYIWLASSTWSSCSVSCGGGTQTRTVNCVDHANGDSIQSPTLCANSGSKPDTIQACSLQACPIYMWTNGTWSSCSLSCGGGVQTRSVQCKDITTDTVASSPSKCTGTAPISTQACNTPACIYPHAWVQGTGSQCSVACGGGTQTFTPRCYRTDVTPNTLLPDSDCWDLQKPPTTGSCNTDPCPRYWYTSAWSQCSASCGPTGLQTRRVACFYTTDDVNTATPLADSACSGSKPATESGCNLLPCPSWVATGQWSSCDAKCGTGQQNRSLTCQTWDGQTALESACAGTAAPETMQSCTVDPCPHWHRQEWQECSKPCADVLGPGVQTRLVTCRMPDDATWHSALAEDPSLCSLNSGSTGDGEGEAGVVSGKPITSQLCNTDQCPLHHWSLVAPSACSVPCGGGVRTATVTCVNSETSAPATDSSLCTDAPPPSSYACNTSPCPDYQFDVGEWSACSAVCGSGTRTRSVRCRDVSASNTDAFTVDSSLCSGEAPQSSEVCTQPLDACSGSTDGVLNGRCDYSTNRTCVCRSGFGGATCDSLAAISNVATNSAAQFGAAGVPLGQPLLITWNSDPAVVPTVSILLSRVSAVSTWPVAQYLAQSVPNLNRFTWNVGSVLGHGLEGGSGYRILVWSTPLVHDESEDIIIADPCAYMSCGDHGTCVSARCVCQPGFSGSTCGRGPCEDALCDPAHSTCDNTAVIRSGQYLTPYVCSSNVESQVCVGNFTGAQCRTPPECAALTCANGGDLGAVVVSGSTCTGTCVCRANFVGPRCEQCGLTCINGGSPNEDCTECTGCAAGFFGDSCECKFLTLTFRFEEDVTGWFNEATPNSLAQQRWSKTLVGDILSAVSPVVTDQVELSVESITPLAASEGEPARVEVVVRFSLQCASTAALGGGDSDDNDNDAWNAFALARPVVASRRVLASSASSSSPLLLAYTALVPLLRDESSPLWQGQITSLLDPTWAVLARDPSGELQSQLEEPGIPHDCFNEAGVCDAVQSGNGNGGDSGPSVSTSTSSLPWPLIGGVIGGAVVLLLVSAGAVLCHRRRRSPRPAAKRHMSIHPPDAGLASFGAELVSSPSLSPYPAALASPTDPMGSPQSTSSMYVQPALRHVNGGIAPIGLGVHVPHYLHAGGSPAAAMSPYSTADHASSSDEVRYRYNVTVADSVYPSLHDEGNKVASPSAIAVPAVDAKHITIHVDEHAQGSIAAQ